MKKIKIFLASSITDLKLDRIEVGDFFRQLNDIYFDRGVRFSLIKCDDYDNAIAAEGKQSQFDREICDSELCFFLFFKKVGDYTRHEFEVALDAFKNTQKPKIVTYFKYITSTKEMEGEVRQFMQMLDTEIKHYYNVYQNIDTLKLGILMQIKLMGLDAEEPKVEDGKVTFGGITVADTQNLPVFSGNTSLSELKKKLEDVTKKYYELREQAQKDPENDDLYFAFSKIATEKEKTEQAIKDAEKAVLEASKRMYEATSKGNLSARQVAAYRAFEQGNYRDALAILDFDEIMADLTHNEQMADGYRDRIQININELLQRIDVMSADGVDRDEAEEIGSIYETVMERIEKFNLEKEPLYDYVSFLDDQNNHEKAIEVAVQLDYYYSNPKAPAPPEKKAALYSVLGFLYSTKMMYAEAETAHKKAISLYEELAAQNFLSYGQPLAQASTRLGDFYFTTNNFAESEAAYERAVSIQTRLAETDNDLYAFDLSQSYDGLGSLYVTTRRYAEAEKMYQKTVSLLEQLCNTCPSDSGGLSNALATAYGSLGELYLNTERFDEAEELFLKEKKICETLIDKNPAANEPQAAICYFHLGNVYRFTQQYIDSEIEYSNAIDIFKKIASSNPELYGIALGQVYNNLGSLFLMTQRYEEAEKILREATDFYSEAAKRNPEAFDPELSACLINLGAVCTQLQKNEEAETAIKKASAMYETLAAADPVTYEPNLAVSYTNLGHHYNATGQYKEAEALYTKALELSKKLMTRDASLYASQLASCYNDLGAVFIETQRSDEAEECFEKAIQIREEQVKENPSAFEPDLAMCYYNLAGTIVGSDPTKAIGLLVRAHEIATRYPEHIYCAGILEALKAFF